MITHDCTLNPRALTLADLTDQRAHEIGSEHADAFLAGPAEVVCNHPSYLESSLLSNDVRAELVGDLRL